MVPELLLTHSPSSVDLVSKHKEWNLGEFLNGEESVKLCLGLGKSFKVSTVHQENYSINFREVVAPETTGWKKKVRK